MEDGAKMNSDVRKGLKWCLISEEDEAGGRWKRRTEAMDVISGGCMVMVSTSANGRLATSLVYLPDLSVVQGGDGLYRFT